VKLRFLEVMAMGHLHQDAGRFLVSQEEILQVVGTRYRFEPLTRVAAATARYWRTDEGHVFGVIANESEPFCQDCDRLRLDSQGRIYGCLSSNHPIGLDLREGEDIWTEKLAAALEQKQPLRFTGSDLSMLRIGG
jgi:cyclic pyranopterin phosphate synthase